MSKNHLWDWIKVEFEETDEKLRARGKIERYAACEMPLPQIENIGETKREIEFTMKQQMCVDMYIEIFGRVNQIRHKYVHYLPAEHRVKVDELCQELFDAITPPVPHNVLKSEAKRRIKKKK